MSPRLAGALQTRRLVGRKREQDAIEEAIEAEGQLRILHFVAPGGIGKTRLLQEVPAIIERCHNADTCLDGGLFDFYHTELHSRSGVEEAIMNAVDREKAGFQDYRKARREFNRLRRLGGDPGRLEELRVSLQRLWVKGFNEISAQRRVVICFDTCEAIQFESDEVQDILGIERVAQEVQGWLTTYLPELKNAVIIFSGRPQEDLEEAFQRGFGELRQKLELEGFDADRKPGERPEETIDYFAAVAEVERKLRKVELNEANLEVFQLYTDGHPLRLALIIELLVRGSPLPQALYDHPEEARQRSADELKAIELQVEQELIKSILDSSHLVQKALPFIALARKGITSELLERLTGHEWSANECAQAVRELKRFSFVKRRPRTRWIFLHDEMYELLDKYVLHSPDPMVRGIVPNMDEVYKTIIAYYDELIRHVGERTTETAIRQKERLTAEQLYYHLELDPVAGYAHYARLADEAAIIHEVGYDMSLRDEMLRFFREEHNRKRAADLGLDQTRLSQGSAVRWVKRYIAMYRHRQALDLIEGIYQDERLRPTDATPHYWSGLQAYEAEARLYLGEDIHRTIDLLEEVIRIVEPLRSDDEYLSWHREHILGWAYNGLGYAYAIQRDYIRAAEAYRRALPHQRASMIEGEQAVTLRNLAFVYAALGLLPEAASLADDSIDLCRRHGLRFGEALSLNVRARVHTASGEPHEARARHHEALRIFRSLEDHRGIGLVGIRLGLACRRLGALPIYNARRSARFFREAEARLQEAIRIFETEVDEPIRLIEAYNELGCAYRDWAAYYRRRPRLRPTRTIEELENLARQNLEHSLDIASPEMVSWKVDSSEDLAQLWFEIGEADFLTGLQFLDEGQEDEARTWFQKGEPAFKQARDLLDHAERFVPPEYYIAPGRPEPLPDPAVGGLWILLGKCQLLRGHIFFTEARAKREPRADPMPDYRRAIEHYALATAYFERPAQVAGIPYEPDIRAGHIHDRLRVLALWRLVELRTYLEEEVNPKYGFKRTRLELMFDRVFGVTGEPESSSGSGIPLK